MSASGPYRVKSRVDAAPVDFRFDGRALRGIEGDTVASALLANGVRVVSRSFKFHRPRGIFSAGFEAPNALVQLRSGARAIPCARATLVPLSSGLEVSSQASCEIDSNAMGGDPWRSRHARATTNSGCADSRSALQRRANAACIPLGRLTHQGDGHKSLGRLRSAARNDVTRPPDGHRSGSF
jgi:hypothetical protein